MQVLFKKEIAEMLRSQQFQDPDATRTLKAVPVDKATKKDVNKTKIVDMPAKRSLAKTPRRWWPGLAVLALAGIGFGVFQAMHYFKARSVEYAALVLHTFPADSQVYLNDKLVGNASPVILSQVQPQQPHILKVEAEGYIKHEQTLMLEPKQELRKQVILLKPQELRSSLFIDSEPQQARIYIDGKRIDRMTPAALKDLIVDKSYVLKLELDGYEAWEQRVEVNNTMQPVKARLTPSKNQLYIVSTPVGARIEVDGIVQANVTPAYVSLRFNQPYQLRILKKGYKPLERRIQLNQLDKPQLNVTLLEAFGRLDVQTQPAGAQVFVDGNRAEQLTPLELKLPASGTSRIRIVLKGYGPVERVFTAQADHVQQVNIMLSKQQATLAIDSLPVGAHILVNGHVLPFKTPASLDWIRPGEDYALSLQHPGYDDWARTIRLKNGERRNVRAKLEERGGRIDVISDPIAVSIYLNDKYMGKSPQQLKVEKSGKHKLRLEKPGYRTRHFELDVLPDQKMPLRVILERQ